MFLISGSFGSFLVSKSACSTFGRRGFDATTLKYFNGDEEAHKRWLGDYGAFRYARSLPYGRRKIRSGTFRHPGAHPAWPRSDAVLCICGVPRRDCICECADCGELGVVAHYQDDRPGCLPFVYAFCERHDLKGDYQAFLTWLGVPF